MWAQYTSGVCFKALQSNRTISQTHLFLYKYYQTDLIQLPYDIKTICK